MNTENNNKKISTLIAIMGVITVALLAAVIVLAVIAMVM